MSKEAVSGLLFLFAVFAITVNIIHNARNKSVPYPSQRNVRTEYTWRDGSGNTNMTGKFTPSKPGSDAGIMELRDRNGNRIGTVNVR